MQAGLVKTGGFRIMKKIIGVLGFLCIAALSACDNSSSSVDVAGNLGSKKTENIVYFPDGGGVEFLRPFVEEGGTSDVRHKVFVVDDDWASIVESITDKMQSQGYKLQGEIDLMGFERSLSFAKPGSVKRVNYRMKKVKSAAGENIYVRLSWALK